MTSRNHQMTSRNNDITIDYVKKECQSMFKNPKCKTVVFEFAPMETSAPKSTAKCYCVNKDPSQVQVLDMRKPLYQLDNSRQKYGMKYAYTSWFCRNKNQAKLEKIVKGNKDACL